VDEGFGRSKVDWETASEKEKDTCFAWGGGPGRKKKKKLIVLAERGIKLEKTWALRERIFT